MASVWIQKRKTASGVRHRVYCRLGGRESMPRYLGAFGTKREADARARWAENEIAALRAPDPRTLSAVSRSPLFAEAVERWIASRLDVAPATTKQHRVAANRAISHIGKHRLDEIKPDDLVSLVAALAQTHKRESIRQTLGAIRMVLDHSEIAPNPVGSPKVKLPREEHVEIQPPEASHVERVFYALPREYRLPLLLLDATGMRVNELATLTWSDVDEQNGRWRVSARASKTGRARWVAVHPDLFTAVLAFVPREDRNADGKVFSFTDARLRMAIKRACSATGTPHFSPHDLRHRRISLMHQAGSSWAVIGQYVGQVSKAVTADTYTHVLLDPREIGVEALLAQA